MKTLRTLLLSLLFLLPLAALAGKPVTLVLEVPGMTCGTCPITVRKALERVPGVLQARADFDTKTATVTYDPDKATPKALTQATANAGYPSRIKKSQ